MVHLQALLGAGRVDPFLSYPTEIQDPDIPELVDLRKSPNVQLRSPHYGSYLSSELTLDRDYLCLTWDTP